MGKNKALAHHTSAYFHTRRVSTKKLSCFRSPTLAGAPFESHCRTGVANKELRHRCRKKHYPYQVCVRGGYAVTKSPYSSTTAAVVQQQAPCFKLILLFVPAVTVCVWFVDRRRSSHDNNIVSRPTQQSNTHGRISYQVRTRSIPQNSESSSSVIVTIPDMFCVR